MAEAILEFKGVTYRIIRLDRSLYGLERSGGLLGQFHCAFGEIRIAVGEAESILPVATHALHKGIVPMLDD